MPTGNVATLKAKLSEYLHLAKSGETIRILDRRRAVADLSAVYIPEGQRVAEALVKAGLAEWHGEKPIVRPVRPRKGPATVAEAVIEDRG